MSEVPLYIEGALVPTLSKLQIVLVKGGPWGRRQRCAGRAPLELLELY